VFSSADLLITNGGKLNKLKHQGKGEGERGTKYTDLENGVDATTTACET
jgi:hypothetical protein